MTCTIYKLSNVLSCLIGKLIQGKNICNKSKYTKIKYNISINNIYLYNIINYLAFNFYIPRISVFCSGYKQIIQNVICKHFELLQIELQNEASS